MVSKIVLRVAAHQGEPVPRTDEIMLELLVPQSATEPDGSEGAAKLGGRRGGGEKRQADEAGEDVREGAVATTFPHTEVGEDRGRVDINKT